MSCIFLGSFLKKMDFEATILVYRKLKQKHLPFMALKVRWYADICWSSWWSSRIEWVPTGTFKLQEVFSWLEGIEPSWNHLFMFSGTNTWWPMLKSNRSINQPTNQPTNQPSKQASKQSIKQASKQARNQEIKKSRNQEINQSINPSIHQSINQSINQSIHQSINPSIHQSINPSIHQSINPSTN